MGKSKNRFVIVGLLFAASGVVLLATDQTVIGIAFVTLAVVFVAAGLAKK